MRVRSWAGRTSPVLLAATGALVAALLGAGGGWAAAASHPNDVTLPLTSGTRPVVVPITPCRLLDTRASHPIGPRATPLGPTQTYTVTATGIQGSCDVPAGAVGLVLNVTVVHGTAGSFLTVWPADATRPTASSLNWTAGQGPTPNQATVGLSTTGPPGRLSFYNNAGTVDLVVDVGGYLADHTFDDRYYTKAQIDGQPPPANPQRVATLHWYAVNETATFPTGSNPRGFAFDGADMWVTNFGGSTVTRIRASDGAAVATYTVGLAPYSIAYDGANMWVVNTGANTVTEVRASDGTTVGTFPVGDIPRGVAFDGAHVWVTNEHDATVSELDPATGAVLATIAVGRRPESVAFDGTDLWVTSLDDAELTEIRASDGTTLGNFPMGTSALSVTFDGTHLWVAAAFEKKVVEVRISDGAVLQTVVTPEIPTDIAFDGATVWVATTSGLTRLQASDGAILGSVPTSAPRGLGFDGTEMWVDNYASGSVSKL